MADIRHISDDEFEAQVLNSEETILVDFWAEWCGPCKMITPILEEIAKEYADKVTVAKINIDENLLTPQKFQVRGIPTLILFKRGEACGTKVGALTKSQLIQFLDDSL